MSIHKNTYTHTHTHFYSEGVGTWIPSLTALKTIFHFGMTFSFYSVVQALYSPSAREAFSQHSLSIIEVKHNYLLKGEDRKHTRGAINNITELLQWLLSEQLSVKMPHSE